VISAYSKSSRNSVYQLFLLHPQPGAFLKPSPPINAEAAQLRLPLVPHHHTMSRKALGSQLSDARSHLAEAQRELELSTFLNKGVLQSNSEFKLRVAELEQENAVLRVAESRLARTEDKVELAERRAKSIAEELRDKEVEWSGRVRAEIEAREALEVEMETMRDEVKGWREVGERVGGLMARSNTRGDRGTRKTVNATAGPSRVS
jgi:hypothetical protein